MRALISVIHSAKKRSETPGQTMVEYSLIILLVVIVCIAVVTQVGDILKNQLYAAIEALPLEV